MKADLHTLEKHLAGGKEEGRERMPPWWLLDAQKPQGEKSLREGWRRDVNGPACRTFLHTKSGIGLFED